MNVSMNKLFSNGKLELKAVYRVYIYLFFQNKNNKKR